MGVSVLELDYFPIVGVEKTGLIHVAELLRHLSIYSEIINIVLKDLHKIVGCQVGLFVMSIG